MEDKNAQVLTENAANKKPVDENAGDILLTNELYNIVETLNQLIRKVKTDVNEIYINTKWLFEREILTYLQFSLSMLVA